MQSNNYWSSTTYANNTAYAWNVNMNDGNVNNNNKSNNNYVWPVRGGEWMNRPFKDNITKSKEVSSLPHSRKTGPPESLFSFESLYKSYLRCRKNKRNTINALRFEIDAEENNAEKEKIVMRKNLFCTALLALLVLVTAGSSYAGGKIGVPKSGETVDDYGTGSDGVLEKGVAWPSPRFTDNGNGTVTDNLTGLIWLQNANCFGIQVWATALNSANTLASGACGLTDGSTAGNWRVPAVNELESLTDASKFVPALPTGHPFTNVQSSWYWSSTTYAIDTACACAWGVLMYYGYAGYNYKLSTLYVWPVRGGQ